MTVQEAKKLQERLQSNLVSKDVDKSIAMIAAAHMTTYYYAMDGFGVRFEEAFELLKKGSQNEKEY